MARRLNFKTPGMVAALGLYPSLAFGNSLELVAQTTHRGGGAYLAWWKILPVVVVFLLWVKFVDWINVDSQKLGADTGMHPEVWNAINVFSFLIGFVCVISIPIYWAGLPVFLLGALAPPISYRLLRRGHLKAEPRLAIKAKLKPGQPPPLEVLPQDEGVVVNFTPGGPKDQHQASLIRARQSPAFREMKELIDNGIKARAEQILIDYTRDAVASRVQIDGSWHPLPPMDRSTGDAVLFALKHLAGLNPQDRRSRQAGAFQAKNAIAKADLELITQGVATGERVQLKFVKQVKGIININQLGMLPEQSKKLAECLNHPGLVIVSAPPQQGFTSSWRAVLDLADRITRDLVGLFDIDEKESLIENVVPNVYEKSQGQTPLSILRKVLLSQPDSLVVPDLTNSETLDELLGEILEERRTVITRVAANSAAEALLRVYSMTGKRAEFEQAVTAVTNQRLMRRLCDDCKVEVNVRPELIQQLGGDPRTQHSIYQPYKLPPLEQRVDETGKPIEMLPCETCGGIGYIGRVAAFETLFVNDTVRKALRETPRVDAVEAAARKTGKLSLMQQGFKLALLGITSPAEVQRVMKS